MNKLTQWRICPTDETCIEKNWTNDTDNYRADVVGYILNSEDAALVASAPELLAIVQLIIKEWEAPTAGVQIGTLIARLSQYASEAREVLAKIEGAK